MAEKKLNTVEKKAIVIGMIIVGLTIFLFTKNLGFAFLGLVAGLIGSYAFVQLLKIGLNKYT